MAAIVSLLKISTVASKLVYCSSVLARSSTSSSQLASWLESEARIDESCDVGNWWCERTRSFMRAVCESDMVGLSKSQPMAVLQRATRRISRSHGLRLDSTRGNGAHINCHTRFPSQSHPKVVEESVLVNITAIFNVFYRWVVTEVNDFCVNEIANHRRESQRTH